MRSTTAALDFLNGIGRDHAACAAVRTQVACVWAVVDEIGRRESSAGDPTDLYDQLDEEVGRLREMLLGAADSRAPS